MNHGWLAVYSLEYCNVVIRYHTLSDSSWNSTSILHPTTVDTAWRYLFNWALLMPPSRSLKRFIVKFHSVLQLSANQHELKSTLYWSGFFQCICTFCIHMVSPKLRCSQNCRPDYIIESSRYSFQDVENVQHLGIISMASWVFPRVYAAHSFDRKHTPAPKPYLRIVLYHSVFGSSSFSRFCCSNEKLLHQGSHWPM